MYDAIEALEELGTSLEDLQEYGSGEGKELNRYALHSARRQEELNEFRCMCLYVHLPFSRLIVRL